MEEVINDNMLFVWFDEYSIEILDKIKSNNPKYINLTYKDLIIEIIKKEFKRY